MRRITYKIDGNPGLVVRLAGKIAGRIRGGETNHNGKLGYRYYPKKSTTGGEWFQTMRECQGSLEAK